MQRLHVGEFTFHAERPANTVHVQITARYVHVFALNGLLDVEKCQPCRLHSGQIDIDLDFALQRTQNVHPADFRHGFNGILHIFSVRLQLVEREVARQVDIHDRKLRKVHVLRRGAVV